MNTNNTPFYPIKVISFDGATTVGDFVSTLSRQIAVRPSKYSGFQLFTDDPLATSSASATRAEHCLDSNLKVSNRLQNCVLFRYCLTSSINGFFLKAYLYNLVVI